MRYRAGVVLALLAVFAAMMAAVASSQPAPGASCSTFKASSEPSSRFAQGDRIIIRGTGFGPRSLVLIHLQQGTRTVELARATANDLGAFRATDAQIPQTVVGGKASINALDAKGSATCAITLTGSARDEGGLGVLYLVWGLALAAFGAFLGTVTYKRWKAERLREAMEELAHKATDDEDDDALVPVATPAGRRRERRPDRATPAPEQPLLTDDSFADEWAFAEQVPAGWTPAEGRTRRARAAERAFAPRNGDATGVFDEVDVDLGDESRADGAPDADVDERPRLPDEWDEPRRPKREPSEAIARLRREVRTWKRPLS